MRALSSLRSICVQTIQEWLNDDTFSMGAALAFYSVLSIGPLLLIIISIAGFAFGAKAAGGYIVAQIDGMVGSGAAQAIEAIIAHSRNQAAGFWATIIGIITLFIAATGVFGQLQDSLNAIWKVKAKPSSIGLILRKRLLSFAMIVTIGFLLLISLVVSAGLSALGEYSSTVLPAVVMQGINVIVSYAVITVLFALIFKILPDTVIRWRDVWIGAALTAFLFTIGKSLIGLYLGHSALSSTYGAAGSLMVVLVWIYYSTQILFLGAEFTQVYARYFVSSADRNASGIAAA